MFVETSFYKHPSQHTLTHTVGHTSSFSSRSVSWNVPGSQAFCGLGKLKSFTAKLGGVSVMRILACSGEKSLSLEAHVSVSCPNSCFGTRSCGVTFCLLASSRWRPCYRNIAGLFCVILQKGEAYLFIYLLEGCLLCLLYQLFLLVRLSSVSSVPKQSTFALFEHQWASLGTTYFTARCLISERKTRCHFPPWILAGIIPPEWRLAP